jgi:hypothetical protein
MGYATYMTKMVPEGEAWILKENLWFSPGDGPKVGWNLTEKAVLGGSGFPDDLREERSVKLISGGS